MLQGYASAVSRHYPLVEQVENALRTLSMFLPASVLGDDTELVGWCIDGAVNVLSMVHQHMAASVRRAGEGESAALVVSPDGYPLTRWLIAALAHTQIALELCALRFGGQRTKWNVVCALEVAKATLRLCLLTVGEPSMLVSGGNLLPPPPLPQEGEAAASADLLCAPPTPSTADVSLDDYFERGARTGRLIPSSATAALESTASSSPSTDLISLRSLAELSGSVHFLAELLHVARPVAFALFRCVHARPVQRRVLPSGFALHTTAAHSIPLLLRSPLFPSAPPPPPLSLSRSLSLSLPLLRRRHRGRFSWAPILVAIFAELGSASLSLQASRARDARLQALPRKYQSWTAKCPLVVAQKAELQRRSRIWFYVLLWNPVFRNATSVVLNKTTEASGKVPLLGRVFGWFFTQVNQMVHANQKIHFYTSNS